MRTLKDVDSSGMPPLQYRVGEVRVPRSFESETTSLRGSRSIEANPDPPGLKWPSKKTAFELCAVNEKMLSFAVSGSAKSSNPSRTECWQFGSAETR